MIYKAGCTEVHDGVDLAMIDTCEEYLNELVFIIPNRH
jgi:hypothetical protein